jgi:hypothetical protein
MGRIEGDFEKGAAAGAEESLRVISLAAGRWRVENTALLDRTRADQIFAFTTAAPVREAFHQLNFARLSQRLVFGGVAIKSAGADD